MYELIGRRINNDYSECCKNYKVNYISDKK